MDDDTLMTAFYACSEDAFQELFHRYFQRLVHFFRQFVSLEDAEDLANEALYRVARTKTRGNRFDSTHGTAFSTWLFRIARNLRIDRMRVRQEQVQIGGEDEEGEVALIEEVPDREPTADEELLARELAERVLECLTELSEIHREVFLLHMDGRILREIADILGIPSGTAGTRLFHARNKLRTCLERKGYHLD